MPADRIVAHSGAELPLEAQPPEFRKKDGSVSKMRSHRGNVPVLPQTKLCPHCPAKFTRTTHLNRHLRTHTGERLHCCETCAAQFTRSDLLARHRKRCNSELSDATRRKSCLACTESKIKCDRQSPCSKCTSKGKECVFPPVERPPPKPLASTSESSSSGDPTAVALDAQAGSFEGGNASPMDLTFQSFTPMSAFTGLPGGIMMAPQADELARNSFASAYDSNLFEPFFSGIFFSGSPSGMVDTSSSSDASTPDQSIFNADFAGVASFFTTFGAVPDSAGSSNSSSNSFPVEPSVVQPTLSNVRSSTSSMSLDPGSTENQHYLYFFFSAFLTQMPVLHAPTFSIEGKPPLLLRAMQACGALYVKTRKAASFIDQILADTRETLIQEFTSNPKNPEEQFHHIIAVILLQTIGLFHQKSEQRATSTIFHGMLVQMIRRSGLIPQNAGWMPTDVSDHEKAWRSWAAFEMTKRLLNLSFLHDCCHAMMLATAPSYRLGEYLTCLPGETALWKAQTADDWHSLLQNPQSPYGTPEARLVGPNLRRCLEAMSDSQLLTQPTPISPFGHFVLAHTLIRILFDVCVESRLPTQGNTSDQQVVGQEVFKIQFGLHNWLQSWLASPDTPKTVDPDNEPPFVENALPFYWFGQLALLAYQEELPPFEPGLPNNQAEARYKLAKQWFRHIRSFLSASDQGATMFWDELIKVRLQTWQIERENNPDDGGGGGVLSFFESS